MYTERLLKCTPGSTHFKNMQLYACGVALYAPAVYLSYDSALAASGAAAQQRLPSLTTFSAHLFAGWTPLTGAIVAVLTAQGMAISFLIRMSDNFAKLFAGGAATFASIGLSGPLLGVPPRASDIAGGCIVAVALCAFHWPGLTSSGSS